MTADLFIRRAAREAQDQLDRLYATTTSIEDGPLDQAGLRDGLEIVEDYIEHNESGLAFEHLLYMVFETGLNLSAQAHADMSEAAEKLGLVPLLETFRDDSI